MVSSEGSVGDMEAVDKQSDREVKPVVSAQPVRWSGAELRGWSAVNRQCCTNTRDHGAQNVEEAGEGPCELRSK